MSRDTSEIVPVFFSPNREYQYHFTHPIRCDIRKPARTIITLTLSVLLVILSRLRTSTKTIPTKTTPRRHTKLTSAKELGFTTPFKAVRRKYISCPAIRKLPSLRQEVMGQHLTTRPSIESSKYRAHTPAMPHDLPTNERQTQKPQHGEEAAGTGMYGTLESVSATTSQGLVLDSAVS